MILKLTIDYNNNMARKTIVQNKYRLKIIWWKPIKSFKCSQRHEMKCVQSEIAAHYIRALLF